MELKSFLGLLPVLIAIPSYWLYIRSIYSGKTVPHTFSWLIWSILAGIGYAGQLDGNAGAGAWNTGITAVVCFVVFLISLQKGEKRLTGVDTFLLCVAALAILLRILTDSPETATLLATLAALIGFTLTIKKAYISPDKENATTFLLNAARNFISLFALNSITFLTFFYPFVMMLANFAVLVVVLLRKKSAS